MMRRFSVMGLLAALSLSLAAGVSSAATAGKAPAKGPQLADGIAAVVNKEVITLRQVRSQATLAAAQLKRQNIPVPEQSTLEKQVLQRMIADTLERQQAEELGIRVQDQQVTLAAESVAQRNNISLNRLREEVEKSGVRWADYLDNLRQELRLDMLRQRVLESTVKIREEEVDAFLRQQDRQRGGAAPAQAAPGRAAPAPAPAPVATGPQVLGLAQILVAVPEGAAQSEVQALRRRAEDLLAKLRGGADFAGLAAASSNDAQALQGGDLGVRPVEGWPDLFLQATRNLKEGQVSGIIQSGNGFHILKVTTRGEPQPRPAAAAPGSRVNSAEAAQAAARAGNRDVMVTQTHARHILVKLSKVLDDDQARLRLEQLRHRLDNGEDFQELARRFSEDASAPQGGDLGWLSPGETVPAFEEAMNALAVGQYGGPVRSPFGWHLIQVVERREHNVGDIVRRNQARQILYQRRAEPAFDDWLSQIRGQAFIDNRLDPEASSRGRRR